MNGPDHYREAERLLAEAGIVNHIVYVPDGMTQAQVADVKERAEAVLGRPVVVVPKSTEVNTLPVLAAAQVHATLALTAATVADRMVSPQQQWGGHAVEVNHESWQVTR